MIRKLSTAGAGILVLAVTGAAARGAANVGLEPSKDSTLIQTGATTDLANGTGPLFVGEVGFSGGNTFRRALIQFPVAQNLPVGSWVHSASLTVNCIQAGFQSTDVSLYRVLADWGEGSLSFSSGGGGVPATTNDSTWNYRFYNTAAWTNPGGDFTATATATTTMDFGGPYSWMSNDVAADVQGFLDRPSQNFGWMLKGDELNGNSAKKLDSRESVTAANRPTVHINFTMGGDADDSNTVDLTDFTFLAANFNQTGRTFAQGDFNRDGTVDLTDFTILAANFNKSVASTESLGATVPEPAAVALLTVTTAALAGRPRRRRS